MKIIIKNIYCSYYQYYYDFYNTLYSIWYCPRCRINKYIETV